MSRVLAVAIVLGAAAACAPPGAGTVEPQPLPRPPGAQVNVTANTPEALVLAFIADYKAWNDAAYLRIDDEEAEDELEAEYLALLAKYCRPGFTGQLIAFGSKSIHDPATEAIVSVDTRGNRSTVRTRNSVDHGGYARTTDFEYALTFEGGRWYLEEAYILLDDGKYPSL